MAEQQDLFEFDQLPPIKGFPELRWTNKRPYRSTQYYPAQLKETYGQSDENGWINKIFWGDNLQVMSHMLRKYRGKVDLIYIDPPYDSKADYKKKIKIKGIGNATADSMSFEEKQYSDIWTNDEYLQFMYERLTLLRELLSDKGSIYIHADWHKVHHLRLVMDEVFGPSNFRNEIIRWYLWGGRGKKQWNSKHENILFYSKSDNWTFNYMDVLDEHNLMTEGSKNRLNYSGAMVTTKSESSDIPEDKVLPSDVWYVATINAMANEKENYPTQKPEDLLAKIILASSNKGDLVFDCFMGSGTTQAVASKL
ncbi:DNA methyltransferase, partial [Desemzia incerta]|uniref:DNA methyltransferase n=3 Tax=Lactobacillales TaxID=186826 RepID=UPI003D02843D